LDVARRLWEISEELTDVRFPLSAQPPSVNGKVAGEAVPTLKTNH
jgi:hypothetical protein